MTERVVCLTIFKISLKTKNAEVAQLVERSPEEGDVTSSTLVLGTNRKIFVTKI